MASDAVGPGSLLQWGSRALPNESYVIVLGCVASYSIPAAELSSVLSIRPWKALSQNGDPCTELGTYPRSALLVPTDGDVLLAQPL